MLTSTRRLATNARSIRLLNCGILVVAAGIGVALWFTIAPPSFIRDGKNKVDSHDGNCEDSPTRTFERDDGVSVKCSWLAENRHNSKYRIDVYCPRNEVRYTCTKTCGACNEANKIDIEIKSNDTFSPSPTILNCKDSESYKFDRYVSGEGTRNSISAATCDWLTESKDDAPIRINKYCHLPEVLYQCPVTCDTCDQECEDDPSFIFELFSIPGTYKDCTWIQESLQLRKPVYCSLFGFSCANSCGYCPPKHTTKPSTSPNTSPTSSQFINSLQ